LAAVVLAVAVLDLQVDVAEDAGTEIGPLGVQVEVTVGVGDGALEHVGHRVWIVERATAIRLQSSLEGLQVPQKTLVPRRYPAQEPLSGTPRKTEGPLPRKCSEGPCLLWAGRVFGGLERG